MRLPCPSAFKGPLVVPELPYLRETFAVSLRLDEPIIPKPDLRELTALCATADVLIERATRLEDVRPFDMKILQDIEALCARLFPNNSAQDALAALGLLDMFPYLEQGLVVGHLQITDTSRGASYLNYISVMNQLIFMGTQMYHDAGNPQHHKYMAHQMALLYQCLNQLQGETKPLKREIEEKFDVIKEVTESEDPVFDMETAEWLQNLAAHCHVEVSTMPHYIHKRLHPMMQLVKDSKNRSRHLRS